MKVLKFKKLSEDAIIPTYATPGDAGLDLHALESAYIRPGEVTKIRTGLALELPHNHVGLIHPRSGLAARSGITVVNAPGTIDSGYRGEIMVLLTSFVEGPDEGRWHVEKGDRVAQMIIQRFENLPSFEVTELSNSVRQDGKFGSTGR